MARPLNVSAKNALKSMTNIQLAFAKNAKSYANSAVVQQEAGRRLLERLDCFTCQPKTILDIGCGVSPFARLLKKRFKSAQIFALDNAFGMLKEDKVRFRYNPHYLCADAGKIPLKDNSIDLIFSNQLLHWLNSPKTFCKEIYRVLRPEGLVLMSTVGPDTFGELRKSWAKVDSFSHVNSFLDMHDLGDILFSTGFEAPVIDRDNIELRYESVKSLVKDIKNQGSSNVQTEKKKALTTPRQWQALENAYAKLFSKAEYLPLSYEIIYAKAFKGVSRAKANTEQFFPLDKLKRKS